MQHEVSCKHLLCTDFTRHKGEWVFTEGVYKDTLKPHAHVLRANIRSIQLSTNMQHDPENQFNWSWLYVLSFLLFIIQLCGQTGKGVYASL